MVYGYLAATESAATLRPGRNLGPRDEQLRALIAIHGDTGAFLDSGFGAANALEDELLGEEGWLEDQQNVA